MPSAAAWARTGQTELAAIERVQSGYTQQIRSMEARLLTRSFMPPARLQRMAREVRVPAMAKQLSAMAQAGGSSQPLETYYACKGTKYFYHEQRQGPGPELPAVLYDGKATYLLTYTPSANGGSERRTAATKTVGDSGRKPDVLSFGYKVNHEGNRWIGDLLRAGNYHVAGVQADPQFGTLYAVQGQTGGKEIAFWFAPKYGYLAVRTDTGGVNGSRYIYRVLDLKQEQGLWFAANAVQETYQSSDNQLASRYTVEARDIRLNAAASSLFDPSLPAGSSLFEQDKNARYMVGPDGEKVIDRRYEVSKNEPYHMSMAWLFVGSLTMLLLLGVGALLRWQRQRAAY
jgi:hypothetical protein